MLSVSEAVATLLASAECRLAEEPVALLDALGRTLAKDVLAEVDVPPADNSAMDGYALRHADWKDDATPLPLGGRVTAGSAPGSLAPGDAARIFTGAEIPGGADTVVMQEHCEAEDNGVRILRLPPLGANIRRRGQDITAGQVVLERGRRLRAQDLGLAASLGVDRLDAYRRLRVAILSTGDELVEPGRRLAPGQIFNSNRYLMSGVLQSWGCEPVDLGVARDEPGAVRELLERAASEADLVISSGGVSVGEEDHVKSVVEELGSLGLWRIAVKPGKPFAFGEVRGKPFIGLPGNPVSVFVTLLVVARPFVLACQGAQDRPVSPLRESACFDKQGSSREEYHRVRRGPQGLELFPNQSSGVLFSTAWADGLVRQGIGEDIRAGDAVDYLPFSLLL